MKFLKPTPPITDLTKPPTEKVVVEQTRDANSDDDCVIISADGVALPAPVVDSVASISGSCGFFDEDSVREDSCCADATGVQEEQQDFWCDEEVAMIFACDPGPTGKASTSAELRAISEQRYLLKQVEKRRLSAPADMQPQTTGVDSEPFAPSQTPIKRLASPVAIKPPSSKKRKRHSLGSDAPPPGQNLLTSFFSSKK